MQALGNDFVMFDGVTRKIDIGPGLARRIADRRRGIGCDQVLLLEPPTGRADLRYRIWNADGGEVSQCGNGARCALGFAVSRGLAKGRSGDSPVSLVLETGAGTIRVESRPGGRVRAHLGCPVFSPAGIPARLADDGSLAVRHLGREWTCVPLAIGNPHGVFLAGESDFPGKDDFARFDLAGLAARLRETGAFPEGVNVGLCRLGREGSPVDLRVDERGVGETPACGSGAAAAAVALARRGRGTLPVTVRLAGGELEAGWDGEGATAWIEGEAREVFDGEFEEEGIG